MFILMCQPHEILVVTGRKSSDDLKDGWHLILQTFPYAKYVYINVPCQPHEILVVTGRKASDGCCNEIHVVFFLLVLPKY